MVNIVYHRDRNRVSVTGHAGCGEAGQDLICASVTILVETLANLAGNMAEAGHIKRPTVRLREGDALIHCNVPGRYRPTVTFAFDAICGGFELLAKSYPENVSYRVSNK